MSYEHLIKYQVRPHPDYGFQSARYETLDYHEGIAMPRVVYDFVFEPELQITVSLYDITFMTDEADFDDPHTIKALIVAQQISKTLSDIEPLASDVMFDVMNEYTSAEEWRALARKVREQVFFELHPIVRDRLDYIDKTYGTTEQTRTVRPGRPGFVYLVRAETGQYKIGKTVDPNNRIKTFGVKLPFRVEYELVIKAADYTAFERELHMRFRDKWIDGEWFALSAEDIEALKREYGND